jgi:hypothetical protein
MMGMKQRYNQFNKIHKGLRAMLCETLHALQQSDFTDPQQRVMAVSMVEDVVTLFDVHAGKEDNFILAPLHEQAPALAVSFESDHEEDHRLAEELKKSLERLRDAGEPDAIREAGRELLMVFHEFFAFNLYHMNREERLLNEALWSLYSDEEIRYMEARLVATIPPPIMALSAKWMSRGLNLEELTEWVKGVKSQAPRPVFDLLVSILRRELHETRFRQLAEIIRPEPAIL